MFLEWDEHKRQSNIKKHGVDFQLVTLFDFDSAQEYSYIRNNEQRIIAYGLIGNQLFVLVYTERNDNLRVISLRKANSKEVKNYVQG